MGQADEFVGKGRKLLFRGEFAEAIRVCRIGLIASPDSVAGRLLLAEALTKVNRADDALTELGSILEKDRDNVDAILLQAECLLAKRDPATAHKVLDRVLKVEPSNRRASELRKRALQDMSKGPNTRESTMELDVDGESPKPDIFDEETRVASPAESFDEQATRVAVKSMTQRPPLSLPKDSATAPPPIPAAPPPTPASPPAKKKKPKKNKRRDESSPEHDMEKIRAGLGMRPSGSIATAAPEDRKSKKQAKAHRKKAKQSRPKSSRRTRSTVGSFGWREFLPGGSRWGIGVIAFGALILSVFAGIQIRSCRAKARANELVAEAKALMVEDYYGALVKARSRLSDAADLGHDRAGDMLWWVRAILAADYGIDVPDKALDTSEASEMRKAAALLVALARGDRSELESLVRTKGDTPELAYARGRAKLGMGQYEEAIAEFSAAVVGSTYPSMFWALAESHIAQKTYVAATAHLDTAIQMQPKHNLSRLARAEVWLARGKPSKAKKEVTQMVEPAPTIKQEAALILAQIAISQGKISDATAQLKTIDPHSASKDTVRKAIAIHVGIHSKQGVSELAKATFQRWPKDLELKARVASALLMIGNKEEARELADTLSDSDSAFAALVRGQLAVSDGNLKSARPLLRKALLDKYAADSARKALGELELMAGNPAKAIAHFKAAKRLTPHGYLLLSRTYRISGKLTEAKRALEKCDDTQPETKLERARLHAAQAKWNEAKDAYRKLISTDSPTDWQLEYATYLFDIGDASAALEVIEQIDGKKHPKALIAKAKIHTYTGDLKASLKAIEAAESASAPSHLVKREKGRRLAAADSHTLAIEDYNAALKSGDDVETLSLLASSALFLEERTTFDDALTRLDKKYDGPLLTILQARRDLADKPGKARSNLRAIASDKILPRLNAERLIALGTASDVAGEFASAKRSFEEAARIMPESFLAKVLLGRIAFEVGEFNVAADAMRYAASKRGDSPGLWFEYGEIALRAGRRADADSAFRKVIGLAPDSDVAGMARDYLGQP